VQDAPIFNPIATISAENQIDNTDITRSDYKSFNNPILKNAARREYIFSTAEGKKEFETAEISAIDSIENIESLTGDKLLIVLSNLISDKAQKHYRDVLKTNSLYNRFNNALYESKTPRHNSTIPTHDGTFDAPYDAGGGRRNKKAFYKT